MTKEESNAYQREWRNRPENKEKIRIRRHKYNLEHKEEISAYNKFYAERGGEEFKIRHRERVSRDRKENPERAKITRKKHYLKQRDKYLVKRSELYFKMSVEERKLYNRKHSIKSKYGLEWEDYLKLIDNGCMICGSFTSSKGKQGLCVDHCHTTGIIRGALCMDCNVAIGMFKDNEQLCYKAGEYLKNSRAGVNN